jgi:hypothetical protein
MSIKRKLGILVFICVTVAAFLVIRSAEDEPYSVEEVVDSVWDKYKVQSTQIGGVGETTDSEPAIFIDVYDNSDIPKVEEYLETHLSKDDFAQYEINVFSNKGIDY